MWEPKSSALNSTSPPTNDPAQSLANLQSVLASLYLNAALGVLLLLLFFVCRRRAKCYSSKSRLNSAYFIGEKQPPNTLDWFLRVLRASDDDIFKVAGFDGVAYVLLLRYSLYFFCFVVVCEFPVLLPIYSVLGDQKALYLDKLTASNVAGPALWGPTVFTWLYTIGFFFFVNRLYTAFLGLRSKYLREKPRLNHYSVMFRGLPDELRSDEALFKFCQQYFDDVVSATVIPDVRALSKVIREYQAISTLDERHHHAQFAASKASEPAEEALSVVEQLPKALSRRASLLSRRESLVSASTPPSLSSRQASYVRRGSFRYSSTSTTDIGMPAESTAGPVASRLDPWAEEAPVDDSTATNLVPGQTAIVRVDTSAHIQDFDVRDAGPEVEAELSRLVDSIEELLLRIPAGTPTSTGIVTFHSMTSASLAMQCTMWTRTPRSLSSQLAPEPRDLLWSSLAFITRPRIIDRCLPKVGRFILNKLLLLRAIVTWAITITAVLFTSFVATLIASIANLSSLSNTLTFLKPLADWLVSQPRLNAFVQGYLPSAIISLILVILPTCLELLSRLESPRSFSELHLLVMTKFFAFLLFNVLLIFAVAGTVIDTLSSLVTTPYNAFYLLGQSLPSSSGFFLSWLLLMTLFMLPLELSQLFRLIGHGISYMRKKCCHRHAQKLPDDDEEDSEEAAKRSTPIMNYGAVLPYHAVAFCIGSTYSVLAPLVPLLVCAYFAVALFVWKHQLLYVYRPKYDSGGKGIGRVVDFFMIGVTISHITAIGLMAFKLGAATGPFLLPLPIVLAVFWYHVDRDFKPRAKGLPMDLAHEVDSSLPRRPDETGMGADEYTHPVITLGRQIVSASIA